MEAVRDQSTVYWQVPLDGATIGGVAVSTTRGDGTKPLAIVDTGTTVTLGDQATVAAIYANIPGSEVDTSVAFDMLGYSTQVYTFPCSSLGTLPALSLVFGGESFAFYPPDLALQYNPATGRCTGSLVGMDS